MIQVILLNEINFVYAPTLETFQTWVDAVTKTIPEKIPSHCYELCISIINTETSAYLNETYRQKKGPTNVLSFNYDAMPGVPQDSLGDLAICGQVVEDEALSQHKTLISHFAHLTVHGVLHLLGYDHINDDEALSMETLEIEILKQLGIDNPYC
ncbi:MAG: rRNA maturation RNase YbeY [Gammaproteobacteria bacterium RIFCSPHIGHO2_12_FULL_40_19]|nr:MAG: rRNA maturation RNase YbeY [Gammaproteobacteria bacterium RIFCSPHIGHO2_12_FULL_40_19]